MPRYRLLPGPSLSQELDAALDDEWRAELKLTESRERFEAAKRDRDLRIRDVDPYGEHSEHSWFRDSAAVLEVGGDPLASERLNRFRAAFEKRAVSTTTLSFHLGHRPPPVGRGGGRVRDPQHRPPRVGSPATRPPGDRRLGELGQDDYSGPPSRRGRSRLRTPPSPRRRIRWLAVSHHGLHARRVHRRQRAVDRAERRLGRPHPRRELGRAYGARLESELWVGPGTGGRITGLTIMTGSSSSTVAGQTLPNQTAEVWQQFDSVSNNLGELPDLIAMAPRRAGGLGSLTSAIGLQFEDALPSSVRDRIVISPAAPTNLGAGTNEDWIALLNRASTPLVMAPEPTVQMNASRPGTPSPTGDPYAYATLGGPRRRASASPRAYRPRL